MKITNARVIVCCPGRNFVTLKIETDQGLTGLGGASLDGRVQRGLVLPARWRAQLLQCSAKPALQSLRTHGITATLLLLLLLPLGEGWGKGQRTTAQWRRRNMRTARPSP